MVESKYCICIGMYDRLLFRAAYFKRNLCTVTLEEVYCFTEFCSFVVFLISEDYHDRSLRIKQLFVHSATLTKTLAEKTLEMLKMKA